MVRLQTLEAKVEDSVRVLKEQETDLRLKIADAESHLHKLQMHAREEQQKHALYRNAAAGIEYSFQRLQNKTKVTIGKVAGLKLNKMRFIGLHKRAEDAVQ